MGRAGARVNTGACGASKACLSTPLMAEATSPALDRIERAIARIEAAAAKRAFDADALHRRHATLREKVEDAIEALDALIEKQAAE